jgi:hypothetical protein
MPNTFSDKTIIIGIILIILIFIKGFYYLLYGLIYTLGLHNDEKEKQSIIEKIYIFLDKKLIYISDLLDTILLFIASYILFFRKNNSIITIIFCIMLVLKFILHFLLLRRFEAYFGIKDILSDKTINELYNIKRINSFITNVTLFIAAGYMLKIIFAINNS